MLRQKLKEVFECQESYDWCSIDDEITSRLWELFLPYRDAYYRLPWFCKIFKTPPDFILDCCFEKCANRNVCSKKLKTTFGVFIIELRLENDTWLSLVSIDDHLQSNSKFTAWRLRKL